MKRRQICAGHVPPNTVMRVRGRLHRDLPLREPDPDRRGQLGHRTDEPGVRVGVGGAGLADLRAADVRGACRCRRARRPAGSRSATDGDLRIDDLLRAWGSPARGRSPFASVTLITGIGIDVLAAGRERPVGATPSRACSPRSSRAPPTGRARSGVSRLADSRAAPHPHPRRGLDDGVRRRAARSAARTPCSPS